MQKHKKRNTAAFYEKMNIEASTKNGRNDAVYWVWRIIKKCHGNCIVFTGISVIAFCICNCYQLMQKLCWWLVLKSFDITYASSLLYRKEQKKPLNYWKISSHWTKNLCKRFRYLCYVFVVINMICYCFWFFFNLYSGVIPG